ncbi:MAG: hypothetical protein EOP47_20980 [Sphingobacteriaceae bacterium]|nr:MAG: hypothetical protein EOP47_20980 [Sphingobacteriaceae bacterium]
MRKLHFLIIAFCCLTFSSFATVKTGPGKEYTFKVSARDLHLKTNNKQYACDYTIHLQFENVTSSLNKQLYKYWITLNSDNSIFPAPTTGYINITANSSAGFAYSTTLNFQTGVSVHWAPGASGASVNITTVYVDSFSPTSFGGYNGCIEPPSFPSSNLVTTQPYFDTNPPL